MRCLSSILVLAVVSLMLGCGGGGSSSQQSNSLPPSTPLAISSTPPTSASEGTPYNYTLQTSVPATLTIVAGPAGAVIKGGAVSWTPTAAQARTANQFTVTASASGQIATQNWSVTPLGTIRGSTAGTCISDTGQITTTTSPSAQVSLWFPNVSGGFDVTTANISNNTFAIPNVAPGPFWLITDASVGVWSSNNFVDFGYEGWGGCTNEPVSSSGTSLIGNVSGLNPWQNGDYFYFAVPNQSSGMGLLLNPGETSGSFGVPSGNLRQFNAANGDNAYYAQLVSNNLAGLKLSAMARSAGPQPITIQNGVANTVSPTLQVLTQSLNFRVNVKGSAFAAMHSSMNPNGYSPSAGDNLRLDISADSNAPLSNGLFLVLGSQNFLTDIDAGDLPYANPFPNSWTPYLDYMDMYDYEVRPQGSPGPMQVFLFSRVLSKQLPSSASPIQPLVGPVLNAKINGADLFTAQTIPPDHMTLTWDAPTIGPATSYRIVVFQVINSVPNVYPVDTYYTNSTSITVPPRGFYPGTQYIFLISALKRTNDATAAPNHDTLPSGQSDVGSALITIQ